MGGTRKKVHLLGFGDGIVSSCADISRNIHVRNPPHRALLYIVYSIESIFMLH